MKNILILGTYRTGKTTFSKILQKELENYQIIEIDSIISALQRTFDNIQLGFIYDNLEDNRLSEFISTLIEKFKVRLGNEYSFIINSDSILPEDLIKYFDLSNTIVYYFVNSKLTVSESEEAYTFFKIVQNKLHFAITGKTAAELIYERVDSKKTHMGFTNWKNSPDGKIMKYDIGIAKNYLNENELKKIK